MLILGCQGLQQILELDGLILVLLQLILAH